MFSILKTLAKEKVYAIVREKEYKRAKEVTNALIAGGIKVIEIAAVSEDAITVIKEISKTEGITVIAGAVITNSIAKKVLAAGATVIASPVYQTGMIKLCLGYKTPLILSASTPNEAYNAWVARTAVTKLFPANALGGADYLCDILRQMPFLNLIPCGSIKPEEVKSYLEAGAVAVGIGRALWQDSKPEEIIERTRKFVSSL